MDDDLNTKISSGPSCSIGSDPTVLQGNLIKVKAVDVAQAEELIRSSRPVVILIEAEWCGDCRRRFKNLPTFKQTLESAGISLYAFTAEGSEYDQFISPEHREFAMKLFSTPIGAKVFSDGRALGEDTTSVLGKRGREAYPAIFFLANGAVQHWSIEDVSIEQLEILSKAILDKNSILS